MKQYTITVNGVSYDVTVEEVGGTPTIPMAAPVAPVAVAPVAAPTAAPAPATAPAAPKASGAQGGVKVNAPMPGTILKINVTVGQAVKSGDSLCVLEAMKMENDIPAPKDGTVASIEVTKGSSVQSGDVLITLN
ncbi:MAG: biotin/lipoyl-binding protein [Ruminococcaceae bacterium]|nr:biotin/lipoyl-binding protein [Oscillospiraceae bacterium]